MRITFKKWQYNPVNSRETLEIDNDLVSFGDALIWLDNPEALSVGVPYCNIVSVSPDH